MKYKTTRKEEVKETDIIRVYIGSNTFRISESVDGKLCVNKTSDGENELLLVNPRSGNEVEIF